MEKLLPLLTLLFAATLTNAQELRRPTVAVADFTTLTVKGYDFALRPPTEIGVERGSTTITTEDRMYSTGFFAGLADAVDAQTNQILAATEAQWQLRQRVTDWERWNQTVQEHVHGSERASLSGAEFLTAYLAAAKVSCVDPTMVANALYRLREEDPDYPANAMRKMAELSGADYLVLTDVSDLTLTEKSFSGFGVSTNTRTFTLTLAMRVIDLQNQAVVYGNVYESTYRERQPYSSEGVNHNIYDTLMKSACKTAAEDLAAKLLAATAAETEMAAAGADATASTLADAATGTATAAGSGKTRVAVAETSVSGGANRQDAEAVSALIEASLTNRNVELVSRTALPAMLKEIGLETASDLTAPATVKAVEGKLHGVDYVIAPTLNKVGSKLILTMIMFNASTGEVAGQSGKLTVNNMDALAAQLDNALVRLGLADAPPENLSVAVQLPQFAGNFRGDRDFPSGDFTALIQEQLVDNGFELLEREDRGSAIAEMAIADADTAATDQYQWVNQEKVAGYLVTPVISRFERTTEAPKKLISGTTAERRVIRLTGKVKVVRVRDNKLVKVTPFDEKLVENQIPASVSRDWTSRDYVNALLQQVAPTLADAVADAIREDSAR